MHNNNVTSQKEPHHLNSNLHMECIHPSTTSSSAGSSSKANNKNKKTSNVKKSNKGVMKLSTDPQSVAARERRHRISDRFKILQSMVPGGSKMDTVSMLDEAIHYVKFLKAQIWLHQTMINFADDDSFMFLPNQNTISPLHQHNYPAAVECDQQSLLLPQLPLPQCCFQLGEENATFNDDIMKYYGQLS